MSYDIKNFKQYPPSFRYLGDRVCLVWSKQNGYQFMDVLDRFKAMADGLEFKIIAVEK